MGCCFLPTNSLLVWLVVDPCCFVQDGRSSVFTVVQDVVHQFQSVSIFRLGVGKEMLLCVGCLAFQGVQSLSCSPGLLIFAPVFLVYCLHDLVDGGIQTLHELRGASFVVHHWYLGFVHYGFIHGSLHSVYLDGCGFLDDRCQHVV